LLFALALVATKTFLCIGHPMSQSVAEPVPSLDTNADVMDVSCLKRLRPGCKNGKLQRRLTRTACPISATTSFDPKTEAFPLDNKYDTFILVTHTDSSWIHMVAVNALGIPFQGRYHAKHGINARNSIQVLAAWKQPNGQHTSVSTVAGHLSNMQFGPCQGGQGSQGGQGGQAQTAVDTYCASVHPPCVKGLTSIGQGFDITQYDPDQPVRNAFTKQALQLTMVAGQNEINIGGRLYQRASEVEYAKANAQSKSNDYTQMSTDKEFSNNLAVELRVQGFRGKKSAGANSRYALQLRQQLKASIARMAMKSTVRVADVHIKGQETISPFLKKFLNESTPAQIKAYFTANFGTHWVSRAVLGGRVSTTITMSECESRKYQKHDIEAAARFKVQFASQGVGGSTSSTASLNTVQKNAAESMAFSFFRLGGDPQYVEPTSFSYAQWEQSVDETTFDVYEVGIAPYDSLLFNNAIPQEKITAVIEAVNAKLDTHANHAEVALVPGKCTEPKHLAAKARHSAFAAGVWAMVAAAASFGW